MERLGNLARPSGETGAGVFVTNFEGPMADCVWRMVHLLDAPRAIPVLYPSFMRELCDWLLAGLRGGEIARIVLATGHDRRGLTAIQTLRARSAEPVCIEELARVARRSPSAFHRQSKTLTALDAAAIPEAAALAGSAQPAARARGDRRGGRLSDRLRESLAIQPGICPPVRRTARAQRGSTSHATLGGARVAGPPQGTLNSSDGCRPTSTSFNPRPREGATWASVLAT